MILKASWLTRDLSSDLMAESDQILHGDLIHEIPMMMIYTTLIRSLDFNSSVSAGSRALLKVLVAVGSRKLELDLDLVVIRGKMVEIS